MKTHEFPRHAVRFCDLAASGILCIASAASTRAAELFGSDVTWGEQFGSAVSLSGGYALAGVSLDNDNGGYSGSVYLFRGLDTATGVVNEGAKLLASDGGEYDHFGMSVSICGTYALIGAMFDDDRANEAGAVYLFRELDTATGKVNECAKLLASDGNPGDYLGRSTSLSGSIGLVGVHFDSDNGHYAGSAYVFRGLDTATGTVNESVKLSASDAASDDNLGYSVSLSGTIGLVAAAYADAKGADSGSAYVFRGLDTAVGMVTENAKLVASDGAAGDRFGCELSLSGTIGVVGSYLDDDKGSNSGSAYLFRGLDSVTGTVIESAKLLASDGMVNQQFGEKVSLSGTTGLIGAHQDGAMGPNAGAAYLFLNLDTAIGTIHENVKITASDGLTYNRFGSSVSIDGDGFLIGSRFGDSAMADTGSAYSGSVSSMTVLDEGHVSCTIDGVSFVSRDNWIIGQATDGNSVTLSAGDTANVTVGSNAVFIGKDAGSDNNTLDIAGILQANTVNIGALTGSKGNSLVIHISANIINAVAFIMGEDSELRVEGDLRNSGDLLTFLGPTSLQAWDGMALQTVTSENQNVLLSSSFSDGFTRFTTVPEPSAILMGMLGLVGLFHRRR